MIVELLIIKQTNLTKGAFVYNHERSSFQNLLDQDSSVSIPTFKHS